MVKVDLSIYNNDTYPFVDASDPVVLDETGAPIYSDEGIYSEIIFGPARDYQCRCGLIFNQLNDGVVCQECGVTCGSSEQRTTQWGNIKLPFFMVNPAFQSVLESIFGSKQIKRIMSGHSKTVEDLSASPYYWCTDMEKLTEDPVDALTINEKVLKIDHPLAIYVLFKELREQKFSKLIKYIPKLLDVIFIRFIPILPPDLRPVRKIGDNITVSEISQFYNDIIFRLTINKIKVRTLSIILKEYYYVYKVFKKLIENDANTTFVSNTSFLRRYLYGKNVHLSAYSVLVPDPKLSMAGIGLNEKSVINILDYQYKRYKFNKLLYESQMGIPQAYRTSVGNKLDDKTEERMRRGFLNYIITPEGHNESNIIIERAPVLRSYNVTGVDLEKVLR